MKHTSPKFLNLVPVFSSFVFGALCFQYYIILLYWSKKFHYSVRQKIKLMSHTLFVFMVLQRAKKMKELYLHLPA